MPPLPTSFLRPSYICSRCRRSRSRQTSGGLTYPSPRQFATSTPILPSGPPKSGYTELSHRALVSLSGVDVAKFLQGLTTNNVDPARRSGGWYTGFLNAQGRVLWDALVYPSPSAVDSEGEYLVEVDRADVENFVTHLRRHKLRSKVTIRDASGEWRVWGLWADDGLDLKNADASSPGSEQIVVADPRLPALGHRIVLREKIGKPSQVLSRYDGLEETVLESYTARRYLHGIPEGQAEILKESSLPLESNMDYLNGIDFKKGCYLGQELTIRTQHTGVVRKRILPVQMYDGQSGAPTELAYDPSCQYSGVVASGADIYAHDSKRRAGRGAGKFLAGVGNIGLALCRLENMTDLRISAERGSYKDGVEFSVGDDGLKVKAFVPVWMKAKEREKMERRARREELEVD